MNFDPNNIKPAILQTVADVKTNFKFDSKAILPALRSCADNFMDYKSRMGRKEYWHFSIAYTLAILLLGIFSYVPLIGAIIYVLGSILFCIVYLTASIRRLHDSNVSGIFLLAVFIPIIGGLFVLYLTVQPSDEQNNTYGEAVNFYY